MKDTDNSKLTFIIIIFLFLGEEKKEKKESITKLS